MTRALFVKGPVIGLPADIPFRADREYTFCRICGELFQPLLERVAESEYTLQAKELSKVQQKEWAAAHNRKHPLWEHQQFMASGRFLSPEATFALVPYGILPLSDLVLDGENEAAGLEAPRISNFNNFEWDTPRR